MTGDGEGGLRDAGDHAGANLRCLAVTLAMALDEVRQSGAAVSLGAEIGEGVQAANVDAAMMQGRDILQNLVAMLDDAPRLERPRRPELVGRIDAREQGQPSVCIAAKRLAQLAPAKRVALGSLQGTEPALWPAWHGLGQAVPDPNGRLDRGVWPCRQVLLGQRLVEGCDAFVRDLVGSCPAIA